MKKTLHKSESRGTAQHGWLTSKHTFSFANYHDPERMNFGLLRVLNDDSVAPGAGFGTHPHDNMEIISIPLKGELEHADNTGTKGVIRKGDVQIMSAGSGIKHSEKNHSNKETVEFLQIWVYPKLRNIKPRYQQIAFNEADRKNRIQTIVSPENDGSSLWINQDAWFSLVNLDGGKTIDYTWNKPGNGLYIFVINGSVGTADENLSRRDGLGIEGVERITISASDQTELLLMEVPMK